jgi:hypothetical protein
VLDDLVGNLLNVTLDLSVGVLATNQTLGSEESVLRVDNGLTLGGNTDETLAILGEADNGGSSASTCIQLIWIFDVIGSRAEVSWILSSEALATCPINFFFLDTYLRRSQ